MIKITRTCNPKGLAKTSKVFQTAISGMEIKEAYAFYKKQSRVYLYNTEETKSYFKQMNKERCSFCTKFIQDFDDEMTVEHIQLKKDAPQLIFEWNNLLCACRTCNTKRSTKAYDSEKYLDPTSMTAIEKYFCYELDGKIIPNPKLDTHKQEQAAYMIRLYQLNRKGLVCKRREFMKELMSDDDFYNKLETMDESSQNIIFLSVFAYYKKQRMPS